MPYFGIPGINDHTEGLEYKDEIPIDKFLKDRDSTPKEVVDLRSQFFNQKGRKQRVRIPFEGGTLVAKPNTSIINKSSEPIINFYPDNREFNEANAQNLKDLEGLQQVFTTVGGIGAAIATAKSLQSHVVLQKGNVKQKVPITKGGQTFLQQRSSNKYKRQFQKVDESLNIQDSTNITPGSSQSTIAKVPNSGALPKNTASKIVRQHTQKAGFAGPEGETLARLDFTPSSVFASINSEVKNAISTATAMTTHVDPTKVHSEQLYDPSTLVNRTKGGAFGTGHQGLANIMYQGIPGWKLKFAKLRDAQQEFSKHHHIEDIAFTGKWGNTSDYKEIFKILNTHKIYPGDSPTNIIGMMDEGNKFLQTGKTSLIQELKRTNFPGLENINKYSDLLAGDAPKGLKKIVDTMFKSPEHGDDFFQGSIDELGRKTPNQMESMFETLPDGTRVPTVLPEKDIGLDGWRILGLDVPSKEFRQLPKKQQQLLKAQTWANRWKTLGVNRKNIKYDSSKLILSKDHIDTLHYKVYNSPKFTQKRELEQMIDDGSYHTLTTEQKAEKIAEVYTIQKNASINVAIRRLEVIKAYLKKTEPARYEAFYSKDPHTLRQWIKDNNSKAANLGWYPESGKIPDFKTLTNPKTAKITDELRIVFSTLVQ